MKQIKLFSVVLILLIALCGCSDERLSPVDLLKSSAGGVEVSADSTIGPPPPEIAKLLWGDLDATKAELPTAYGVMQEFVLREINFIETQQAYYQKYIDADGIAIIGSDAVDDIFFHAAKKVVLGMTSKRPETREWLSVSHGAYPSNRFRMILVTPECDIPRAQAHILTEGRVCDRYIGACVGEWYCVVVVQFSSTPGHEDELSFSGTFIHEMGHAIHYALRDVDPTFQTRLDAAYEDANTGEGGSNFGGMPNEREFWAEATWYWFNKVSNPNPSVASLGKTFQRADPLLYQLLDEVYPLLYLRAVDWEHTLPDE